MKKNLFLRLCLTIVVGLSFNSCRQDILPEQETYHNTSAFQLTSKRISLDEAQHKAKLLPELEKAEAEFKSKTKNSAFGKTVNYGSGVSIDTDDVIYIENGTGFYSYTFNIKHENAPEDAPVENLVLSPLADGTYRELLLTYNLTSQEKQMLATGIPIKTSDKVTITELVAGTYSAAGIMSKSITNCGWEPKTMWNECSSGDHNGTNANECDFIVNWTKGTPPTAYVVMEYKCTALPVSTALGDDGTGGGSGPQNGPGGLGGGNPEPEVPTIPNLPPRINQADCKKVKEQFAKEPYKNKVATINKSYNYNLKKETGFKENKDGSFTDLTPSGKDALTITFDANTKGYTHVHLNDRGKGKYTPEGLEEIDIKIRMFSPADVNVLMEMADFNKSPENFADLYGTMLSSDGTFVIKFTGTAFNIKTGFDTAAWRSKFQEYFEKYDKRNPETNFLLFMKNEMQIQGISLYEVKSDGKVFEQRLNTAQTKAEPFECGN